MLEWLGANADPLLATGTVLFGAVLFPTILSQWRTRASTVTLSSSVPTVLVLAMFTLVYAGLGLWITATLEAIQTGMWVVIALQRFFYGGAR